MIHAHAEVVRNISTAAESNVMLKYFGTQDKVMINRKNFGDYSPKF